ncbi:hypothetical protein CCHR01_12932 [Colletotrichum chrysophilum]|uniref:Uncharacterized protein n=1 Tax=Colletotrichum chrysophilum TaxID=1836956 RepID=A0AAD9EDE4_9PEZI|nr:hypothetical protein CCHR01_12932 [Colletotrichum chrysophilum]
MCLKCPEALGKPHAKTGARSAVIFPNGMIGQYPSITQHHTSAMSAHLGFPRSLGLVMNARCYDC